METNRDYYSYDREELLEYVPKDVQTLLSVGCGGGVTEAKLVKRGVQVTGIELNPDASAAATERGIEVLEGDVTAIADTLADRKFDCLLYADVLEHLPDPILVLSGHVPLLNDGGTVIISVPNFRSYRVFWQLFVRGHIRYEDKGIFDRTHLRMTTRKMVLEWLDEVGLTKTAMRHLIYGRKIKLLSAITFGLFNDFLAAQVVVVGKKGQEISGEIGQTA